MDRKEYFKAYYQAHKEARQAYMKEYMAKYRETHPDYVERNREKTLARHKTSLQKKVEA
jgi:hypothetical protein